MELTNLQLRQKQNYRLDHQWPALPNWGRIVGVEGENIQKPRYEVIVFEKNCVIIYCPVQQKKDFYENRDASVSNDDVINILEQYIGFDTY